MYDVKYRELQKFVGIQKLCGRIIFITLIVISISLLVYGIWSKQVFAGILISLVVVLLGWLLKNLVIAIGEFCQVVMDIEKNTRKD